MLSRINWILFAWAMIATIALAWVLGRESMRHAAPTAAPSTATAATPVPGSSPSDLINVQPATTAAPQTRYASTIPPAFRGSWDEMIADRCYGREARYRLGARTVGNFEVEWEVTRVKLYSPTEIDVAVTMKDENANQVDDTFSFKLVDNGQTLTGRKPGSTYFKKCPLQSG